MIPFDPPLQDASEIRKTLVQMAVEAREQLQSRTQ
jgi:putative heme iron utilization protein